jgi:hypothetical protein
MKSIFALAERDIRRFVGKQNFLRRLSQLLREPEW